MTVGSQVKGCLSAIKGAEASVQMLAKKGQDPEAQTAYQQAADVLSSVRKDMHKQAVWITNEEPQYKY